MKATEFCYWLQGYFELNAKTGMGSTEPTPTAWWECIRNHLALVARCDPEHTNAFVHWLTIVVDNYLGLLREKGVKAPPPSIARIRSLLNAQFRHEIDEQSSGGVASNEAQAIHDGDPNPSGALPARPPLQWTGWAEESGHEEAMRC